MQNTYASTNFSNEDNQNMTAEILKAKAPQHPALQRLSAKLNDESCTGSGITRYDRMHHRHNRT